MPTFMQGIIRRTSLERRKIMDKQKLMEKAEAALEKNLDILAAQDQPCEKELAVKAISALTATILSLNLQ
jgi:hypothetical protein